MSRNIKIFIISVFCAMYLILPQSVRASNIIFQDNFKSYEEGLPPQGWVQEDAVGATPCNAQWIISNGMVGISINNESSCITHLIPDNTVWSVLESNYILEFDMKFVNGTDHNILYRYIPQDFYPYELHFQSPGDFVIELPANFISNTIEAGTYSNGNTYHIKIVMGDKSILVYIDGVLVRNVILFDNLPPGKIALRAGTGADQNSETWFDNIMVTRIVNYPTDKEQCKKDGWKDFSNPTFKNQGDCVSYVATHGRNPGNG